MTSSPLSGSVGGAGGGGNTVIYQQGGTAGAGVYTTWADTLAAAQAKDGPVTIYIDPSVDPPAIPAGTHDLELRIRLVAYLTDTPGAPCTLAIDSGAVLQDAVYFENIAFEGNLTTPLLTASGGNVLSVTFARCRHTDLGNGDAFCTLPTGTNTFFLQGSTFAMDAEPFAALASGKNVTVYLDPASSFDAESFTGSAGTLTVNAAVGAVFETQAGFSGTLSLTNQSAHSAKVTDLAAPTNPNDAARLADLASMSLWFGLGLDGAGGAGSPLTQPGDYTTWTLAPAANIRNGGYPIQVTGTLDLGAGAILNNDGPAGTNNATTPGSGASMQGQLANATINGGSGGGAGSDGAAGGGATVAMGGSGGKGGAGGSGKAGGAGGTFTAPVKTTVGRFVTELVQWMNGSTWNRPTGGSGGGGGAGGAANPGSGGGAPGGVLFVAAKDIVMATGSRISANGGAGGSTSVGNGGGGAGGGGGLVIVICDTLTTTDADSAHFQANGGLGGTASGGGSAGAAGSAGHVYVFVRGRLYYST